MSFDQSQLVTQPYRLWRYLFIFELEVIHSSQIWGAEYQENNAILVAEENLELVLKIATRENCPVTPVGKVTGDGKVSYLM